jgi:hypothetical protein
MDENCVIEKFRKHKVITIGQLVEWLKCSMITARRRLKKWQSHTSINKNGRYYTLPQIPVFDANGLWKYRTILFSKHGNLKQTIVALITASQTGLSAIEIAGFADLVPNSSLFSRLQDVPGIRREKHQGRFIYLSDHPKIYSRQMQTRATGQETVGFPSDAEAVEILVHLIKHPDISMEQLSAKVSKPGKQVGPGTISKFLQFHNLLKKTSAIRR